MESQQFYITRDAEALALKEKGQTYAAIGRHFGVTGQTAKHMIRHARSRRDWIAAHPGPQLNSRAFNALRRHFGGAADPLPEPTPQQIATLSEDELLDIPEFGRKSIPEVKAMLAFHGLSLRIAMPRKLTNLPKRIASLEARIARDTERLKNYRELLEREPGAHPSQCRVKPGE